MNQTYTAASSMSNADFHWNQSAAENMVFSDHTSNPYNMNTYNENSVPQQPYVNQQQASTQLARRPVTQHLMQTQRYENPETWGQYGDDQMVEVPGANGAIEENDNIELLEERAAIAKRDSQSKRKQIPPFVQKLSRCVF